MFSTGPSFSTSTKNGAVSGKQGKKGKGSDYRELVAPQHVHQDVPRPLGLSLPTTERRRVLLVGKCEFPRTSRVPVGTLEISSSEWRHDFGNRTGGGQEP